MTAEGLTEPHHLERWLVDHIEVLDPTLKIVTTQFNRWSATAGTAAERLDILALARSGELVVIELKRGSDKNVHLQAISYGALVSGFTTSTLGAVHAEWLNAMDPTAPISPELATRALKDHVDDDWSDEVLQQTRLLLVAEQYPPLVLTTVQWLAERAPELRIECHQYTLFKDEAGLMVAFDRLFPVNDLSDHVLSPTASQTSAAARVATSQRQAKSVVRIHQAGAIPVGAEIRLELATHVKPDVVQRVEAWLDMDPIRRRVTWVDDAHAPLHWAADTDVPSWTPSGLRNRIFVDAGLPAPNFSAADAWIYQGSSLYEIANSASAGSGAL